MTSPAIGSAAAGRVYQVSYGHSNMGGDLGKLGDTFKARFNDDYYTFQTYSGIAMLSAGMAKAKSIDPVKVATAMSGLRFKSFNGEVEMRKLDHQLQQTLYISKWAKATPKTPYSEENTGYNFAMVKQIEPYVASTPTSCQMKRP